MLWYDESCVKSAVLKVKTAGCFLLVFVKGQDNLSNEYESCLDEITGLKNGNCVPLKLSHDSTALQQFKQIYIKVPIPSVFLIQNNGIPICVVSTDKISEISSAISKTVIELKSKSEEENEVATKNAVTESPTENIKKPLSKPLEYAKNIGYKVADVPEGELQQRLSEIRAFPRFLLIDSSSDLHPDPVFPPISALQQPKIHSARLQFRLPNNETPSWEFPDLSTLKDVRAYITEKVNLPPNFKFMRTYPRTAITPKDEKRTLSDLCLTPNATLIVVPVQVEDKNVQTGSATAANSFFFLSVLNAFWLPFFTIIKFLKKHIFGEREGEDEANRSQAPSTAARKSERTRFGSNVHGFRFDRDDSDGEHPDNGNSTQQSYRKK